MSNTPDRAEKPLVSVVCLTYNHEKYIAEALESFVSQQTGFRFEIIVHDDASTDKTSEIVARYQAKYPHVIRVIVQSENQMSRGVCVPAIAFASARGKYIAYCEGDDYWIRSDKIQLQADYLDKHPEIGAVFTDVDMLFEGSGQCIESYYTRTNTRVPVGDVREALLCGSAYRTCTSMFRTALVVDYAPIARRLRAKAEDLIWWLSIAAASRFAYLRHSTATYRVRVQSASHFLNLEDVVRFARSTYKIRHFYNRQFGDLVSKARLRRRYREFVAEECIRLRAYGRALKYAGSPTRLLRLTVKRGLKNALLRALARRMTEDTA